ncbi:hypothetical protein V8G54_010778 [Vigna mungo]|uniref:NB-ARC domain-containing protein n=1 Tax=Vigna mungo TaxID=3915 RepID=A0AAQ3NZ52_VIGMU
MQPNRVVIKRCTSVPDGSYKKIPSGNKCTSVPDGSYKKIPSGNKCTSVPDGSYIKIPSGCVGKSTLVKEIARKAKEKNLFDVVVKVEITADPNPHKIQEEIAYVLGLRLEGEGENVRADCLRRRLKKESGNILLILDDLWDKLDLNKLGIPVEDYDDGDDLISDNKDVDRQKSDNKDGNSDSSGKVLKKEKIFGGHKGCKILVTSRDKNVLSVEMDVKSTFCVRELDDNDALMLFQKLVGVHNEMSSFKQEIVKDYLWQ